MRKKGMAKVQKVYLVDFFIDGIVNGDKTRITCVYGGRHESVRNCLYGLLSSINEQASDLFDDNEFFIGIHSIQTRPDAYVNHSYINRTIWNDEVLNDKFYC